MESNRTWLSSVVFIDIVGYSKCPVSQQIEMKEHMNGIIAGAIAEVAERDRIVVDSGDGAAMCFLGDPEDALFSAVKVRDGFMDTSTDRARYDVRIGINLGPVKVVRDINQRANVLGDGINVAQRVMAFGNDNQILVSRSFYEVISCLSQEYAELFHYRGVHKDKHVREHAIYEVNLPSEVQVSGAVSAPPTAADSVPIVETAATVEETLASAPAPEAQSVKSTEVEPVSAPLPVSAPAPDIDTGPISAPPGSVWESSQLRALERELAEFIGPLAKVLVKKASARHQTASALLKDLTANLATADDQHRFMRRTSGIHLDPHTTGPVPTTGQPTTGPTTDPVTGDSHWPAETIEALTRRLAGYVGPLAKVLVKKAAIRTSSREHLLETLGAEIETDAERVEFIRKAHADF